MQTSLFTALLSVSLILGFAPVAHAENPRAVGEYLRRMGYTKHGNPAPADYRTFYGTPEVGVKLLTKEAREKMLADLQQRVINLQKSRMQPGLSPTYSTDQKIYERVLRRVGNAGLAHYRRKADPTNRLVWDGKTLKEEKDQTADEIETKVDAVEQAR